MKKTVNQDDVSAYHLFYADGVASPGTDLTFFHWASARERRGTGSVVRTGLRLGSDKSLEWWRKRLRENAVRNSDIVESAGRPTLDFEDPEGQRFCLVVDPTATDWQPWSSSPIAPEHQIRGLGPISLSVPALGPTNRMLSTILGLRRTGEFPGQDGATLNVYQMAGAGLGAELQLIEEPDLAPARPGAGGVHHLAFRTSDRTTQEQWLARLTEMRVRTSGLIDRFYFQSLYFREPNGILFEIATDGPGFAVDEPVEKLGERLSLPPFLEGRRAEIEASLMPLDSIALAGEKK